MLLLLLLLLLLLRVKRFSDIRETNGPRWWLSYRGVKKMLRSEVNTDHFDLRLERRKTNLLADSEISRTRNKMQRDVHKMFPLYRDTL